MATILIVEDNLDLRTLYEEAMSLEGYAVVTAANGQEALDILGTAGLAAPSLIHLGLMMPVMNGWTFLQEREKEAKLKSIPVVVCSASKDDIPLGVPFLKKPVDLDQLLAVASRYCSLAAT